MRRFIQNGFVHPAHQRATLSVGFVQRGRTVKFHILPLVLASFWHTTTLCIVLTTTVPNMAKAESWAKQQEFYNEKSRLELELFRQKEELEILREENKKQTRTPPAQNVTPKKYTSPAPDQMDTWQYQQDQKKIMEKMEDLERQMKYQAQRNENERAASDTGLVLEDKYYAVVYENLKIKLGFDQRASQEVVEALKARTYADAKAAQSGDAKAQEKVGDIYYDGLGVQQDYAEAARWFYKSAIQNNSSAQYKLAMMYLHGEGVPVDMDYAVLLLRRAATLGHVEAIAIFDDARKEAPSE